MLIRIRRREEKRKQDKNGAERKKKQKKKSGRDRIAGLALHTYVQLQENINV